MLNLPGAVQCDSGCDICGSGGKCWYIATVCGCDTAIDDPVYVLCDTVDSHPDGATGIVFKINQYNTCYEVSTGHAQTTSPDSGGFFITALPGAVTPTFDSCNDCCNCALCHVLYDDCCDALVGSAGSLAIVVNGWALVNYGLYCNGNCGTLPDPAGSTPPANWCPPPSSFAVTVPFAPLAALCRWYEQGPIVIGDCPAGCGGGFSPPNPHASDAAINCVTGAGGPTTYRWRAELQVCGVQPTGDPVSDCDSCCGIGSFNPDGRESFLRVESDDIPVGEIVLPNAVSYPNTISVPCGVDPGYSIQVV